LVDYQYTYIYIFNIVRARTRIEETLGFPTIVESFSFIKSSKFEIGYTHHGSLRALIKQSN